MEISTYAILDENGVCIDRIVTDENFSPEDYIHPILKDMDVQYTLVKEIEGEEYFLDVEASPYMNLVTGVDASTDILSQLTDDQKQQLISLLLSNQSSNSSENTTT